MFTGIIKKLGTIDSIDQSSFFIRSSLQFVKKLEPGSSIAINGCCLTVEEIKKDLFKVTLMPETFKKTMFGQIRVGDQVNLETSVTSVSLFDGHMVSGHVDTVATISAIKPAGNSHLFTFKLPHIQTKYIIEKGSIAVNGISLTVISVANDSFTVGIIPYTWQNTMLNRAKIGDKVNIEVDMLAKYIEKITQFK